MKERKTKIMKNLKDITRIVRFAIASTPDKYLWTLPQEDVDEARPDNTYYIAELMVGEEKGEPVKKTFESLMDEAREAGGSWRVYCELFAALLFYFDAAIQDKDISTGFEYIKCIKEVLSVLNEKFGADKASWRGFISSMRSGSGDDVKFIKLMLNAVNK